MKKSELTQLTQIIEHIVAKEVRKQLPGVMSEVFKNMMGKPLISEQRKPAPAPVAPEPVEVDEEDDMKTSLRELFSGVTPVEAVAPAPAKHYAKDPLINQILNETVSDLRQRERMSGGMSLAAAAYATPAGPSVLREGEESPHAPMGEIPQGVSVLDVAKAGMVPKPVTEALTNFNRMKQVLEASKKRRF